MLLWNVGFEMLGIVDFPEVRASNDRGSKEARTNCGVVDRG